MGPMKLGVVMDAIGDIKPEKDSTFALLLEAQSRDWQIHYMELDDLSLRDGTSMAHMRRLEVADDQSCWFELGKSVVGSLTDLDVILMRKDPPVDMDYIVATYVLEQAEKDGVLVVNSPRALRDTNEKVSTAWFPECCPPSLVTRSMSDLRAFLSQHGRAVVKPLNAMGGESVFSLTQNDLNTNVILETMTDRGHRFIQAQAYIADISQTVDKRILLIDGKPVPSILARLPAEGDLRANLAVGGKPEGYELSERDRWICSQIGPALSSRGHLLVGVDVIGDYFTEINVTSPTGIR